MASGTTVDIPSNGGNVIQMTPGLPSVALQASGAIPYPQYGAQQRGIPTNALQQVPQKGPLERFLKAEPKVLGAIQIMIGLILIGFGGASLCLLPPYYPNLSGLVGYPFWGGIFFISSGSLCVSVANRPSHRLVKSSVGMNITSAVMSLTGSVLNLCNLILPKHYSINNEDHSSDVANRVGCGLFIVLMLFSLLEFCIAVSLAHFGCQVTCYSDDQPTVVFVPYQVIGGGEVAAESNPLLPPPPLTYSNVVTKSQ